MSYSVLMSVYYKEKPLFLKRSIDSVMEQTIAPDDFVIVCDGPLTPELDEVLLQSCERYGCLNILRKEKNEGLGSALHDGLLITKNEIIMRMDSDDVCLKHRAEIQLPFMNEYELVGSSISEFENSEDNIIGYRVVPTKQKDIEQFAKRRNPFNHPSVMFRKSTILKAGNYQTLLYVEDYFLWVRVLLLGSKVANISEPLVNMRSGLIMRSRRSGKTYRNSIKNLRKFMLDNKMISKLRYFGLSIEQTAFLLVPVRIKEHLYSIFLRKKKAKAK